MLRLQPTNVEKKPKHLCFYIKLSSGIIFFFFYLKHSKLIHTVINNNINNNYIINLGLLLAKLRLLMLVFRKVLANCLTNGK